MKLEIFILDNKFPIFLFNLFMESIISLFCLIIEFGIFIRFINWHKTKNIIVYITFKLNARILNVLSLFAFCKSNIFLAIDL